MKKIGTLIGLLSACVFSFGLADGSGQAGAYLRMGVGARALGMGGAFVAVADDGYSAYWNPAGLAKLQNTQASFMHARLKLDRNFDFINYVKKDEKNKSAVGFSFAKFGVDNIPETRIWRFDSTGKLRSNLIYGNPYYYFDSNTGNARVIPVTETGKWADGVSPEDDIPEYDSSYDSNWTKEQVEALYGTDSAVKDENNVGYNSADPVKIFSQFDDSESAYFVSYAKTFDNLHLGANLKYMTHKLYNAKADGVSMDLGLLYDYSEKITFGLALRDISGEMKWNTPAKTKDTLPLTTTFGVAYKMASDWLVAMDYNKIQNMSEELFFGTEKWLNETFAVRAGSYDGDLSAGFSYVNSEWIFEYGYQEQDLGDIHRFSTTKSF